MILLAGLIAMMAFAFAACGNSDTDEKSTTESQTKSTEQTEATEETTTEAADDYDIMKGSKLEANGSELLLYGNDFLLIMPNNDDWGYEQTSPTSVTIYDKDSREDGFGGNLVTIMAFDPSDKSYEDFPDYAVAGSGKNVNKTFIALFPSDAQFDPNDPEDEAEYMELFNHVKKIGEGAANSPFQTADSDPEPQQ